MFVAISKIAFVEQADLGETFASHDHERAVRNIDAFDITGSRWIDELVRNTVPRRKPRHAAIGILGTSNAKPGIGAHRRLQSHQAIRACLSIVRANEATGTGPFVEPLSWSDV